MRQFPNSILFTAFLFTGNIFFILSDMEFPDRIISSNYSTRLVMSQKLDKYRAIDHTDEDRRINLENDSRNLFYDVGNLSPSWTNGRRASATGFHTVTTDSKRRDLLSTFTTPENANKKEVITVVLFDKIKGYLNWMQDWFLLAARENCSTTCIVTENKKYVRT